MNTNDPTELHRRVMEVIVNDVMDAPALDHEEVWTTDDLTRDFEVLGFLAPYVIVRRKVDGVKGSLLFKHSPRIYFGWQPDRS